MVANPHPMPPSKRARIKKVVDDAALLPMAEMKNIVEASISDFFLPKASKITPPNPDPIALPHKTQLTKNPN